MSATCSSRAGWVGVAEAGVAVKNTHVAVHTQNHLHRARVDLGCFTMVDGDQAAALRSNIVPITIERAHRMRWLAPSGSSP
jgi:S-adenosylmethionine/arginine decarboxylase-like enzyme